MVIEDVRFILGIIKQFKEDFMGDNIRFCPYAGHSVSCNLDVNFCKRCSAYLSVNTDFIPEWKQRRKEKEQVKHD